MARKENGGMFTEEDRQAFLKNEGGLVIVQLFHGTKKTILSRINAFPKTGKPICDYPNGVKQKQGKQCFVCQEMKDNTGYKKWAWKTENFALTVCKECNKYCTDHPCNSKQKKGSKEDEDED